MNIFDQYGIKEVADVTIYSIHKKEDGSGDIYYVPALYLDTLKVTTTEKTASNVWAQGGLGNSRLICWDYGKEINLSITDALCTPASLGLCWGGILGSDWKDAHVKHTYGISYGDENPVKRLSRFEKAFYPRNDRQNGSVSKLLPHLNDDMMFEKENILGFSSIVDGTEIEGFGYCKNRPYKWRMAIESSVKSIAIIPNRFFSTLGKHYPLNIKQTVGINTPSDSFKYEIIYKRGLDNITIDPPKAMIIYNYEMEDGKKSTTYSYDDETKYSSDADQLNMLEDEKRFPYLKIRVDNDDNYTAYFGTEEAMWLEDINKAELEGKENEAKWYQNKFVETEQFKQLDLWNRFDSINEMIYFLITKYEDNIWEIKPKHIEPGIGGVKSNIISSTSFKKGYHFSYRIKNKAKIKTTNESAKITSNNYEIVLKHKNDDSTYDKNYGIVTFTTNKTFKDSKTVESHLLDIINEVFSVTLKIDDIIFSNYSEPTIEYQDRDENDIRTKNKIVDEAGIPFNNINVEGESIKKENRLWCYINPKTMTPYDDDYWFHQGQPYLKKSLTLAPNEKNLKAQKITIEAGQFPGMYKIVGETYIRSRETGEDERVQISFPLCKIKSDQTLTLEAEGDPTTFALDVEVARPENGIMMEITTYEVEKEEELNELTGKKYIKDGSTIALSE